MRRRRLGRLVAFLLVLSSVSLSIWGDDTTRKRLKRSVSDAELSLCAGVDTLEVCEGMIVISGYEKTLRSSTERMLITNMTERILLGAVISIEYQDKQGRQLHQRELTVDCDIPGGETRQVDFPSWDKQKTMYYYLSPKNKRLDGTPYKVKTKVLRGFYELKDEENKKCDRK